MKDCMGNRVNEKDMVAVVYHPAPYEFSIEIGAITKIGISYVAVTLQNGSNAQFKQNNVGWIQRIVKLNDYHKSSDETKSIDAVGQEIKEGSCIAIRRDIELGNTCKGFIRGGKVVRCTSSFVFYKDSLGKEHRKKKNLVIVVKNEEIEAKQPVCCLLVG